MVYVSKGFGLLVLALVASGCKQRAGGVTSAASALNVSASVLMQHNDLGRTGTYLAESTLTRANVATTFGRLYERYVDGPVYAQPLYAEGVIVNGFPKNIFIVATSAATIYAFDANDNTGTSAPVWPARKLGTAWDENWGNVPKGVATGIVSTPVIDPTTNHLYVVAKLRVTSNCNCRPTETGSCVPQTECPRFYLYKVDIRTGQVVANTVITASFSSSFGVNYFDPSPATGAADDSPHYQTQRAGLLLLGGKVYVAFAANGEKSDLKYHGWIMAYDAATLAQTSAFCLVPRGPSPWGAGVWQAGKGLASDGANIYVATSNASFPTGSTAGDTPVAHEDQFLKLNLGLWPPVAAHVPGNSLTQVSPVYPTDSLLRTGSSTSLFKNMEVHDLDLGSCGPIVIPIAGANQIVGGSKMGIIYLLDTSSLALAQSFQGFKNQSPGAVLPESYADDERNAPHLHGSLVFRRLANGDGRVYGWSEMDRLRSFRYVTATKSFDLSQSSSCSQGGMCQTDVIAGANAMPGAGLSISAAADGGNSIVWASIQESSDTDGVGPRSVCPAFNSACDARVASPGALPGRLYAFDADSLQLLWSDRVADQYAKFTAPLVAHGKVVMGTFANRVVVYGLNGQNYKLSGRGPFSSAARASITPLSRVSGRWDLFTIGPVMQLSSTAAALTSTTYPDAVSTRKWRPWHSLSFMATTSPQLGFDAYNLPVEMTAKLTGISRKPGHLLLFVTDSGGVVRTNWSDDAYDNARWHEWWPLANSLSVAPQGAPVGVASPVSGLVDVFVTDTDGVVQWIQWNLAGSPNWAPGWTPLSAKLGGGTLTGVPGGYVTAIAKNNGTDWLEHVFATDTNGKVWWNRKMGAVGGSAAPWGGWEELSTDDSFVTAPGGPVTVIGRAYSHRDVFAVNRLNGQINTAWWDGASNGGKFAPWWAIPGDTTTPGTLVTALSVTSSKTHLFTVNPTGAVVTAWWEPATGWHGWSPFLGTTAPIDASVAGFVVDATNMSIFVQDTSRIIRQCDWNGTTWGGWN